MNSAMAVNASTAATSSLYKTQSNSSDGADEDETDEMVCETGPDDRTLKRKRYGSGLGNLGNTCFMNSTLQCLAHTEPLRQYFVSGEYERDLNRDNPLGTGGELATQFAKLLMEMWGVPGVSNNGSSSYGVVYPRNFKTTLGRHAEQFLGYDQHDSQELATYLLDALHEDTNRVTKKPYIEKPEQGEDEPDDVAADRAWKLHLRREDSKVLEHFVGQVKSRVQCPTEGCGRVSTTFDPFMYLSVPIPGASDRTISVTFLPLEGTNHEMNIVINKAATMLTLAKKIAELWETVSGRQISSDNIHMVDVWNNHIYATHTTDLNVDKITDKDVTYAFELEPADSFDEPSADNDQHKQSQAMLTKSKRTSDKRFALSLGDMKRLNVDWQKELEHYVIYHNHTTTLLDPARGSVADRIEFWKKLEGFLDELHKAAGPDGAGEDDDDDDDDDDDSAAATTSENDNGQGENGMTDFRKERSGSVSGEATQEQPHHSASGQDTQEQTESRGGNNHGILSGSEQARSNRFREVSRRSNTFESVRTDHDVAVLEFLSKRFRKFTLDLMQENQTKFKEGIVVEINFHGAKGTTSAPFRTSYSTERYVAPPLVLRLSPTTTVFQLREIIARRIKVKPDVTLLEKRENEQDLANTTDEDGSGAMDQSNEISDEQIDVPLEVMRQLPMTYTKKTSYGHRNSPYGSSEQLGCLTEDDNLTENTEALLALSSDDDECQTLVNLFGNHGGTVGLHWPAHLVERYFDIDEYQRSIEANPVEDAVDPKKVLSVRDCVEKYCQMEQLDETEMWYCDRCKKHVRAWKQFHLYRTPPILIVHLKRFHYSATTHRRDKIDSLIDFPLKGLDLRKDVMEYAEGHEPIYDCYAVSNHYGRLGGGHYTAYAQSDGTWCNFDDGRVETDVDESQVVSSAAYVLYYRRRDLESHKTTPLPTTPIFTDSMDIDNDDDDNSHPSAQLVGGYPQELHQRPAQNGHTNAVIEDDSSTTPEVGNAMEEQAEMGEDPIVSGDDETNIDDDETNNTYGGNGNIISSFDGRYLPQ